MSSLKDLASLIMVPSLVKDGRLDTVKPLGNSIIHPDATGNNDGTDGSTPAEGNFTFSRGSNLAATRVDVNGLIEKGRENVLLQSQSFDNASWDKTRNVVTANTTTAPDGTNTADKIAVNATFSTNTSRVKQDISVSGLNTISLYAKADEITEMLLFELGNNNGIYFNLTSGSFVSYLNGTTNIIDYNIEDAGNDWYRYSITYSSSITRYAVYLSKSGSYVTDFTIGEGFYVWGGQIESGLVATDYIETGASTAQSGILEDLPRLDYSGGASCPSLLLEPQRSNLIIHSEYLDGLLDVANGSVSYNTTTSPEGLNNAALYTEDSSTNSHYIDSNTFTFTSGADFVISVFAKYNGRFLTIQGSGGRISSAYGTFNLQTGVVEEDNIGTASIEDYGNGWYRCSLKVTATSTGNGVVTLLLNDSATGGRSRSYTGDGSSGLYYYGFQTEQGSYPTSYIPTMGSAVTRSEDVCIKTQTFNDIKHNDVTLFYDFDHLGDLPAGQNQFVAYFGSGKYLNIAQYDANVYYVDTDINGSYFFAVAFAATEGRKKVAIKIDGFSWKVFFNGSKIVDTTLTQQSTNAMTEIILSGGTASRPSFQSVHQALAFPTALTDSECIALTTI